MPEISVIICAYNAEKYIDTSVKSVLNQTYSDFELIIVNDGSKDDTLDKCTLLAAEDKRIKIIDIPNGGLSNARNTGMSAAKGKYIVFCDADDRIDSGELECMIGTAENDGADLVICGYYLDFVKDDSVTCSKPVFSEEALLKSKTDLMNRFVYLKRTNLFDAGWNKLYKRSIIEENRLKMPVGELFEDTAFVLQYLKFAKVISISDQCFYHYNQRSTGITKKYDKRKYDNLRKRYFELKEFTASADASISSFCDMFYLRSVFSSLSELYGKGVIPKLEKKNKISDAIRDEVFKKCAENASASGISDKLTLITAKSGSVYWCGFYCKCVFFLKNKLRAFFNKIK